jgi:hypothetical protein
VKKNKKSLVETHPKLAKEAYGWDPSKVTYGSHKKVKWKCRFQHEWDAVIKSRSISGNNCPICSGHKVLKGVNDLLTLNPEIAKEAFNWDPSQFTQNSGKKVKWICKFGHITEKRIADKVNGVGCPVCSGHEVLEGFNDLASTNPEIAKEAHGWDPKKITKGHDKKLNWKCKNGHKWEANVYSRTGKMKVGCPVCSNKKLVPGLNDLDRIFPELATEVVGIDPRKIHPGSNKKITWKCSLGHEYKSDPYSRTSDRKSGCPYCSGNKVLEGFNDLLTTHPQLVKEIDGWDPKKFTKGSDKKMSWICQKNHKWKASISSRTSGRGCPSCAVTGFNPNQEGYIYFLIQPKWEIYQIGITNNPEDRLSRHKRNGFELIELRGPLDGHTVQELETAILRYLKSQKADLSPDHIAGKFDGYSESWTIDSYKVNNLKELIDKTRDAGY